jgi:hypothetical protein
MAGQCLRGQPEAAWGGLHQVAPASLHQAQAPELAPQAPARWGTVAGVLSGDRSWGGGPVRSPQLGHGRRNHLVELVEGAEGSDSPMVATAMVTGAGRNRLAMAAANQIARGATRAREGGDWGWAGSVWPTQTRTGGLSQARWAGRISRPVGLAGQVGRIGFCQLDLIQI